MGVVMRTYTLWIALLWTTAATAQQSDINCPLDYDGTQTNTRVEACYGEYQASSCQDITKGDNWKDWRNMMLSNLNGDGINDIAYDVPRWGVVEHAVTFCSRHGQCATVTALLTVQGYNVTVSGGNRRFQVGVTAKVPLNTLLGSGAVSRITIIVQDPSTGDALSGDSSQYTVSQIKNTNHDRLIPLANQRMTTSECVDNSGASVPKLPAFDGPTVGGGGIVPQGRIHVTPPPALPRPPAGSSWVCFREGTYKTVCVLVEQPSFSPF